jgi:signal transduction histidine kinase
MLHRGRTLGVIAAFDRVGGPFNDDDEQLLTSFSASAANAVALAQSVQEDRLRSSLAAADSERRRWARELHDETLQALGGLRVLLSSALRTGDPERAEHAMRTAIEQVEHEIANLRAIIADLRPAALDELGLVPAIEALLARHRGHGLKVSAELDLPAPGGARLESSLESTVYRVLQEALTNVVKHAQAGQAQVRVRADAAEVTLEVVDDGAGFDLGAHIEGFGLAGMRERINLAGGQLDVVSGGEGTRVRARIPMRPAGAWLGEGSRPGEPGARLGGPGATAAKPAAERTTA